jgi:hypothetical protein
VTVAAAICSSEFSATSAASRSSRLRHVDRAPFEWSPLPPMALDVSPTMKFGPTTPTGAVANRRYVLGRCWWGRGRHLGSAGLSWATSCVMHRVACVGAYAELLETGTPGPLTVAVLLRLGGQVGRTSTFPPHDGYSSWSDDAVVDLIGAMFIEKPQLVVGCMVKAHDDASLERLVLVAIRNWLKDQAKATEVGKLRSRLENVLGGDPRFVSIKTRQATGRSQNMAQRSGRAISTNCTRPRTACAGSRSRPAGTPPARLPGGPRTR